MEEKIREDFSINDINRELEQRRIDEQEKLRNLQRCIDLIKDTLDTNPKEAIEEIKYLIKEVEDV